MRKFAALAAALIIFCGIATATEAFNTSVDKSYFDQPKMAKDGLGTDYTDSINAFLKNGNETEARIPGMPVMLLGSRAKMAANQSPAVLPTLEEQFQAYVNVWNSTVD